MNLTLVAGIVSTEPEVTLGKEGTPAALAGRALVNVVGDVNVLTTSNIAGKLNFYLSAVDDVVKQKEDNPSIISCKINAQKVKDKFANYRSNRKRID